MKSHYEGTCWGQLRSLSWKVSFCLTSIIIDIPQNIDVSCWFLYLHLSFPLPIWRLFCLCSVYPRKKCIFVPWIGCLIIQISDWVNLNVDRGLSPFGRNMLFDMRWSQNPFIWLIVFGWVVAGTSIWDIDKAVLSVLRSNSIGENGQHCIISAVTHPEANFIYTKIITIAVLLIG